MKKINALILLINSLSKSEKKAIYLQSNLTKGKKVYMELFALIDKQKIVDSAHLQQEFQRLFSNASFHPVASYLYDFILNTLVRIKVNQDKEFALYQKYLMAKVLEDRNLDSEYYDMIQQLKADARELHNYNLLLTIQRMELNYLRTNEFQDTSEKKLLQKQHKTNESLKILRQINEQSSLYELLLLRMQKINPNQLEMHKQFFNDLIVSEITLVSSLNKDVFEIQKLHQLFQAQYLIYVGDYKSALNSFIELDKLFNNNKQQWNNPPMYYARVLEGILGSLSGIKAYDKMDYFLQKLQTLDHSSLSFQTEIACVRFIYTVVPYLERKEYAECKKIIERFDKELISRIDLLTPYRYLQLSLYMSVVYLCNKEVVKARKQMTRIINSDSYVGLSLFRPMQIINLVIHYELADIDIITSRVRSIKRINKIQKTTSKLEDVFFNFLGTDLVSLTSRKRESFKNKIKSEFEQIESDNKDNKLLSIFDLKGWMLSKIG